MVVIYQKLMFFPNLHYINHSIAKHEDSASGSVVYHISYQTKTKSQLL